MFTLTAPDRALVNVDHNPEDGLISVHHWGLFPYAAPRPAKLPFYRAPAEGTPIGTITVRRGDGHLDKVVDDFLSALGGGYTTTGWSADLARLLLSRGAHSHAGAKYTNALGTVHARKLGDFLAVDLGGRWWEAYKDKPVFWATLQSFTDLRVNIIPAV